MIGFYLDSGNSHCTSSFDDLLKGIKICFKDISPNSEVIIRADSGYGSKAFIDELLESDYKFVVKGYSSATSKNLAEQILWDAWEKVSPGVYVAEYTSKHVYGDARVVVCEIFTKDGERKYSHLITNIPASELNAIELFHYICVSLDSIYYSQPYITGKKNIVRGD